MVASSPTIKNTILWNNFAPLGPEICLKNNYPIASTLSISYSDVMGGMASIHVEPSWTVDWGKGMIDSDPLLTQGPHGAFYLSQIASGQLVDSPCVDKGSDLASNLDMAANWTRTDEVKDSGTVDMGYHYYSLYLTIDVPKDYPTIQQALDVASYGDIIIVAPGTYIENITFKGKAITVKSSGGNGVTTIDGNQAGCVVMFGGNECMDSILDGFTLTNGTGTNWSSYYGGGIYCGASSLTIRNNIISGNTANYGGGIYISGVSPTITNNDISHNSANEGGGIYAIGATPYITNNNISDNSADYGGGIVSDSYSSQFSLGVTNNSILRNSAVHWGGGIFCRITTANITNNTIVGNSASYGGGIWCENSNLIITNTILWNNFAHVGQELWLQKYYTAPSILTVSYSTVQGGKASTYVENGCTLNWGSGMIDSDPLLFDPDNSDFHLTFNSPCRGSGDNATVAELSDIDGDTRIAYGTVDMGADEFYTHLYHTGDTTPGGAVELKLVDLPGTNPVILWIGSGVLSTPINTKYGDWYLQISPLLEMYLGSITTPSGVTVLPYTFDQTFPNIDIYMQALIGKKLTNLSVMNVN